MGRLLIIYLIIILVTRIIRGFQESQRSAPKRQEPGPLREVGDVVLIPELETYSEGEREVVTPRPFQSIKPAPATGEGVTLEGWTEIEKEPRREEEGEQAPLLPELSREKPAVEGLFSQPEAWVQGIIMSEVLLPPRSQRPWRPPV
ncbi:MAG: hypothetical protein ACOYEK_02945 [bacterium]|jgi:hypothetical protein